jgi:hypothetical protein
METMDFAASDMLTRCWFLENKWRTNGEQVETNKLSGWGIVILLSALVSLTKPHGLGLWISQLCSLSPKLKYGSGVYVSATSCHRSCLISSEPSDNFGLANHDPKCSQN